MSKRENRVIAVHSLWYSVLTPVLHIEDQTLDKFRTYSFRIIPDVGYDISEVSVFKVAQRVAGDIAHVCSVARQHDGTIECTYMTAMGYGGACMFLHRFARVFKGECMGLPVAFCDVVIEE